MTGTSQSLISAADEAGLSRAVNLLRAGELVAVPTETVYGLAARADSDDAVAKIYRAKGRPDFNPLIVHVAGLDQAKQIGQFDVRAEKLARDFWPGALTLVVERLQDAPIAAAVTAGLPTIAIRCPAHPIMRSLLKEAGVPLAAPSANRSGAISPTTAQHVARSLRTDVGMILDGGACEAGIESTIVALRDDGSWQILRDGPITSEQIGNVLGRGEVRGISNAEVEAPGQLTSHYSPGKPMRLGAVAPEPGEFHIGFGEVQGDYNLSPSGDLAQAAARLYSALHVAAESSKPAIAVAIVPETGIGSAINDRLRRAAA